MGMIMVEDNKYCCDFCGCTHSLSEVYDKENSESNKSHKTGMYTVVINEIVANAYASRVSSYKDGIRAGRESFTPSERRYKKYVVCKDCLRELEKMHYNMSSTSMHPEEKDTINLREWSIPICDLMESLLAEKNIVIPNDDRLGDEGEARIYGSDYYTLEDGIVQLLKDLVNEVKKNPQKPINTDTI